MKIIHQRIWLPFAIITTATTVAFAEMSPPVDQTGKPSQSQELFGQSPQGGGMPGQPSQKGMSPSTSQSSGSNTQNTVGDEGGSLKLMPPGYQPPPPPPPQQSSAPPQEQQGMMPPNDSSMPQMQKK